MYMGAMCVNYNTKRPYFRMPLLGVSSARLLGVPSMRRNPAIAINGNAWIRIRFRRKDMQTPHGQKQHHNERDRYTFQQKRPSQKWHAWTYWYWRNVCQELLQLLASTRYNHNCARMARCAMQIFSFRVSWSTLFFAFIAFIDFMAFMALMALMALLFENYMRTIEIRQPHTCQRCNNCSHNIHRNTSHRTNCAEMQ